MPQMPGSGPYSARVFVILLLFALTGYILGRPLYWHLVAGVTALQDASGRDCPPCTCNCPSEDPSLLPPGFGNHSTGLDELSDCNKADSSLQGELDKHSVDLLSEELKLQGIVADESQQRADFTLLEVKKLSSQYQKEAEKCNFGMETCEEARERAEEALIAQMKVAKAWEQRARELGWSD
eukprot:c15525_g1_i2 orf=185-727(+)